MKILSNKSWNAILDLITERNKQIDKLERKIRQQQNLIEAQRRFISAHVSVHDIDFPNSHPVIEPNTDDQWRFD